MNLLAITTASLALMLVCLQNDVFAFSPLSHKNARVAGLKSAETETAATATSPTEDDGYDLTPAFRAAFGQAEKSLADAIPKKDLLHPLLHFTKEYLAASQAAFNSGKEDCAPPNAVGRIMQAIQLGIKYGTGENKFLFGSSHKALRGDPDLEDGNTVDFYEFGCK